MIFATNYVLKNRLLLLQHQYLIYFLIYNSKLNQTILVGSHILDFHINRLWLLKHLEIHLIYDSKLEVNTQLMHFEYSLNLNEYLLNAIFLNF